MWLVSWRWQLVGCCCVGTFSAESQGCVDVVCGLWRHGRPVRRIRSGKVPLQAEQPERLWMGSLQKMF